MGQALTGADDILEVLCMNLTFSDASIWEVSEQLKQDGGSSRGSGDQHWIVVPTGISGEEETFWTMDSALTNRLNCCS